MEELRRARHVTGQMRHLFDDTRDPAPKRSDSRVDIWILPVACDDSIGLDTNNPVTFRISCFNDAP